ncbi:hypothetical protein ACFRFG_18650, partial [Bacillus safensis]|uniref:hypothetical protein n=1 Tax=Bacillus safensis TaxID=561879 RepID=UPI00366DB057
TTPNYAHGKFGRATCGAGGSLILAIASKVRATCRLSADPIFPPMRDRQKIRKTLAAPAASNHMNKLFCVSNFQIEKVRCGNTHLLSLFSHLLTQ